MGKFCALVILIFTLGTSAFAQSQKDIDNLNEQAESMLNQNPKQSQQLALQAKGAAEKDGYKKGLAKALALLGVANYKVDAYDSAKSLLTAAATVASQAGDTSDLAFCKYWLGLYQLNKGEYNKALDLFQAANGLAEKTGDKKNVVRSIDGRASIYEALGEDNKAEELYQRAYDVAKENNFKAWYPGALFSLGNMAYKKRKLDDAIEKYNESIQISDEQGNLNNKASCYQQLSSIYSDKKDSKKAMQYAQKAMDLFQQMGSMSSFSYTRLQMCYILLADKQFNVAIDLAKLSLEEGKVTGETELQKNAAEVLYYCYLYKGDKAMALDYHVKFHELSEASRNQELGKKLAQADLEANFQKEREIAKAEQAKRDAVMNAEFERQKLVKKVSIIGIFLLMVISGLAVFAFNQKRKDNTLIANEKDRTDQLLLSILPVEIVEEIKHSNYKGKNLATVLFANIKSFQGGAGEKVTPAQLQSALDRYFKAFDEIVTKHKLEKIKTAGDAYLCIGSAALTDKETAYAVMQAALEMREYVEGVKKEKKEKGEIFFDISIGVHSGPLVAGIVGIRKYSYDIWGDTVNIAARMEQHGERGKINISGTTYSMVNDRFICMQHGEVETKKKEKISMYFVAGANV